MERRITHIAAILMLLPLMWVLFACGDFVESSDNNIGGATAVSGYLNEGAAVIMSATATSTEPIQPPVINAITTDVPMPAGINDVLKAYVNSEASEEQGLVFTLSTDVKSKGEVIWQGDWIYVVVGAFPMIEDDISIDAIRTLWKTEQAPGLFTQLFVAESELDLLTALWGKPGPMVTPAQSDMITQKLWNHKESIAIIPFDRINPRMKVLAIDGVSAVEKGLAFQEYLLKVTYVVAQENTNKIISSELSTSIQELPATNRDEEKMTILMMTGVTALVRETAYKMSMQGATYPGEKIAEWFEAVDIRHISNEVPFYSECPDPDPPWSGSRFCSPVEFISLFDSLNIDVVELTGNHLLDYGVDAFLQNLDLYIEKGYQVYGGGSNTESAREALLIEDHGNRIAFVGCNEPGPESVFATDNEPGTASCEMEWLLPAISALKQEGYLVVVTFQHYEACQYEPMSLQKVDFQAAAEAGAVIVSGSQSHCTQTMTFIGDSFVHYGLGNLFFDQMWSFYRPEFIDQHVFYNGEYINTVLKTAILEDASQPRPMTVEERRALLQSVMEVCEWE